jgi:glycosyltransferase involved in cell wall biosynthesis
LQDTYHIAVCLSHAIQYKSPLLLQLASQVDIDLKVFYYSDTGVNPRADPYHGFIPKWDIPLLEGYEYEYLPNYFSRWDLSKHGFPLYLNAAIINRILSGRFDAVVIHSYLYITDWLVWMVAKLKGIPVFFYGEMYPRQQKGSIKQIIRNLFARTMIKGSDVCLAIGTCARKVYQDEFHIPDGRIILAPYAVNNDFFIARANELGFQKAQIKKEIGIPSTIPVILCVAGMVPKKRHLDLIKALSTIKIPFQLVLVGDGPLFEEIRATCMQYLPGAILAGFQNQTAIPRYYAVADIFVLPSEWEEFGLVVNEAMCFSLPIIASNKVGCTLDLVHEGENGYTFTPGDISSLTGLIENLLLDQDKRTAFGRQSKVIIDHWSYQETINGIRSALYQFNRKSEVIKVKV